MLPRLHASRAVRWLAFPLLLLSLPAGVSQARAVTGSTPSSEKRPVEVDALGPCETIRITQYDGSQGEWLLGGTTGSELIVRRAPTAASDSIPYRSIAEVELKRSGSALLGLLGGGLMGFGVMVGYHTRF